MKYLFDALAVSCIVSAVLLLVEIFGSKRLNDKTRENILRVLSISVPLIGIIGIIIALSFIIHDIEVLLWN